MSNDPTPYEHAFPPSSSETRESPFRQAVRDASGVNCGCACHTGTGYDSACIHCQARQESPASEPEDIAQLRGPALTARIFEQIAVVQNLVTVEREARERAEERATQLETALRRVWAVTHDDTVPRSPDVQRRSAWETADRALVGREED